MGFFKEAAETSPEPVGFPGLLRRELQPARSILTSLGVLWRQILVKVVALDLVGFATPATATHDFSHISCRYDTKLFEGHGWTVFLLVLVRSPVNCFKQVSFSPHTNLGLDFRRPSMG